MLCQKLAGPTRDKTCARYHVHGIMFTVSCVLPRAENLLLPTSKNKRVPQKVIPASEQTVHAPHHFADAAGYSVSLRSPTWDTHAVLWEQKHVPFFRSCASSGPHQ